LPETLITSSRINSRTLQILQSTERLPLVRYLSSMGNNIHAFVAGVGTGGTITGVGEALKKKLKEITVVAVEPASSPVLSGGEPGPHQIAGIGAGFIPDILNRNIYDEIIKVTDRDAALMTKMLAKKRDFS